MRVRLVASATGGDSPSQYLISYLINESVVLDAGSIGFLGDVDQQRRIRHVFLSHSHADHVVSLPMLLENVYDPGPDSITVHGSRKTLAAVKRSLFNNELWPDFFKMSTANNMFVHSSALRARQPVTVEGLTVTPIPVNHAVPTFGFLVSDEDTTVVFPSDTGPTEEIWDAAREAPNLKGVFLESSFPDTMRWLADASMHLTPQLAAREVDKLGRPTRVLMVHMKARYRTEIEKELAELDRPDMEICIPGKEYVF